MSREGGEGGKPTPVPVNPPPNAMEASQVNLPTEIPPAVPQTPAKVKTRKDKTWNRPDGTTEPVVVVRRGYENSRIRTSDGSDHLVPNSELV